MKRLALVALVIVGFEAGVFAQSAPVLTPEPATRGPVANAIAAQAVRLDPERSVRPQRPPRRSRTWRRVGTGALVGMGVGAALGMTVGQEACLNEPRWHCVKVGVPFAAIGGVVAWLHR